MMEEAEKGRLKNHRIYRDRTLVEDPLAWTLEQFEKGKLPAMIERAGYPGLPLEPTPNLGAAH
jgi:hypothetical protein